MTDDDRFDQKLDLFEREFEAMESTGKDLLRRLSDVSTPRNRSRVLEEVDHAGLMNRLVSRVEDPVKRSNAKVIPHVSVERFVMEADRSSPISNTRFLTDGIEIPVFGDMATSREPKPAPRIADLAADPRHARSVVPDTIGAGTLEPMRNLESLAKTQLELELSMERHSRKSSEGFAMELMRTLRSLESQLNQQAKISEVDCRTFEREITCMRSNVEKLELERQSLLDAVMREGFLIQSEALLKGRVYALEQHNAKLSGELASVRQEAEILRASVIDLERSRAQLEKEVQLLRKQNEFKLQIQPVVSLPLSNPVGERMGLKRPVSVPPYSDHEGLDMVNVSPRSVDPQRMPRSSLENVTRPSPRGARTAAVIAPYSDHEGIEVVKSPKAIAPQRMALSDIVRATRATPTFSSLQEDDIQTPPTPTTPKPRNDSLSPKPRVDVSLVEKELLQLNLERQELESWLGRFPPNTAGRTLAERKEKFIKERRLSEVEKGISEKRMILKNARLATRNN